MTKRILALVLAVVMVAMSLPIFAFAASGVTYYDYDVATKTLVEKTLPAGTAVTTITAGDTEDDIMPGWNLIVGNVTIPNYFFLLGEVYFILADGATLTTEGIGVELLENNGSFTVYAQSTGEHMGQIVTTGCENAAGIGGGYGEAVGDIAIYGGVINVTGGDGGAGIGSGVGGSCGNISIFGGIINAVGGDGGAGIGSGLVGVGSESSCENIAIQGGIVNAVGGVDAAGIGGSCDYTTVVDGYVKAVAGGETADPIDNLMTSCTVTTVADENTQYINYEPVAAAAATCTEAGHAAYVIDHVNALYYTAFPFTADGLIGNAAAFAKWEGHVPALGHDYVIGKENHTCTRCDLDEYHDDYDGDYICDACHAELLDDAKYDKRWLLQVMAKDKSAAVQSIANDYRGQIQAATTVADVLALYDAAENAIRAQINEEEAAALALAKTNAIAALETAAGNELTEAMSGVLEAAVAAVNAAKTVEAVDTAKEAGLAAIALQLVKDAAISELVLSAGDALTEGLAAVLDEAKAAVNDAATAEAVADAKTAGLAAIALQKAKDAAIAELKAIVENHPSAVVAVGFDSAKTTINALTNAEEVTPVKEALAATLTALVEAGNARLLAEAKAAAKDELTARADKSMLPELKTLLSDVCDTIDAATTVEEVALAKENGLSAAFRRIQGNMLAECNAMLESDSLSDAMRALLEMTAEMISATTNIDVLDEAYTYCAMQIELQREREAYLPECEMILASDQYSEEVKTLVREFMEALNEACNVDEIEYVLYEYAPAINLQAARDQWMAELETLLPEEPSDAVKKIVENAEGLILFGEDSSVFDNVFDIARRAVDRQLLAEADTKAMEDALKQMEKDLAAANGTIDELNSAIESKEATIAEKQAALDAATEQLNAAKADLETAKEQISALEATTAEQKEALDALKAEYDEAEQTIEELQAEIERLKALLDDPTEPTGTGTEPTGTGADEGMLGDANGDGAVNMKDVLLMRKYLADMDVEYNARNADVNGDGAVNMKDVLTMRKFLAEVIDVLGA